MKTKSKKNTQKSKLKNLKIGICGLGYVGPFGSSLQYFTVVGFDKSPTRINDLKAGLDKNGEFSASTIIHKNLSFASNPKDLENCNFYIVTVPTPIDAFNNPDLTSLVEASKVIAKVLKGDL